MSTRGVSPFAIESDIARSGYVQLYAVSAGSLGWKSIGSVAGAMSRHETVSRTAVAPVCLIRLKKRVADASSDGMSPFWT